MKHGHASEPFPADEGGEARPRRDAALAGLVAESPGEVLLAAARMLEEVPTAFFALSTDWRFTYVNAHAERVLHASREELLGGNVWALFPAAVGTDFETSYRHAMTTGEPVRFDAHYPDPLNAWYEVRAWPTPVGLAVYFFDITERVELQQRTERSARHAALTAAVTAELTRSLDPEETAGAVARALVPELADWCIVSLAHVDESGAARGLRDIGWWHADPEARPVVERYVRYRMPALLDQSFLYRALRAGPVTVPSDATEAVQAVLAPGQAREDLGRLAPASAAALPLRARGRTLGAISLFNGSGRPSLGPEELALACEVSDRAGLALDNLYLYGRQRRVAEELQRSLLTDPPPLSHLDVAVRYVPAGQAAKVGGDWYDVFDRPDGSTMLMIGDVAGHDVRAAAAMGQVRSMLRGIAVTSAAAAGPAEVLHEVDRALRALRHDTVATAAVVCVDEAPVDGAVAVRWSSAGHPPPMVVGPDGAVTVLRGTHLLLGIDPETPRADAHLTLRSGDTLLLYTDGLVERRDGGGLRTGIGRLAAALADLAGLGPEDLCDRLLEGLLPGAPEDDVAVMAVRLRP
ncbi:SpoIIE family protein phosphatase [Georgenia thermotolerans]|uniref:SpoIIE family protein phosphatase n=1 Tax=Georgenia thermotolerans TaxID=527326 RepID=A0A7J5UR87_9MICO|nr:SpoIIE family protein phosphatase [Georgenia thermotolerans]KAE8764837.1 SpoIIE family protein phosphatase [Georgenia thermotolerans]